MKTCKQLESFLDEDTCFKLINVYDENLSEMSRYGKFPNSQLEIHIEGSEGEIPHFHIQIKNGKPKNNICHVKFLSAQYLRDKNDPMNTLNSAERKALYEYMIKKVPGADFTNWESALGRWNEMNPAHFVIIKNYKCPDYRKLSD